MPLWLAANLDSGDDGTMCSSRLDPTLSPTPGSSLSRPPWPILATFISNLQHTPSMHWTLPSQYMYVSNHLLIMKKIKTNYVYHALMFVKKMFICSRLKHSRTLYNLSEELLSYFSTFQPLKELNITWKSFFLIAIEFLVKSPILEKKTSELKRITVC